MTRSVSRNWRLSRIFYFVIRNSYYKSAAKVKNERWRNSLLMIYAPLSLIVLFLLWGGFIIFGFGCINYGFSIPHSKGALDPFFGLVLQRRHILDSCFGDIAPVDTAGRILAVIEACTGLIFPCQRHLVPSGHVRCCAKARIPIVLLDSKAGSNPTGLTSFCGMRQRREQWHILPAFLEKYEQWGAEMLEAYLSYPAISFYRSQHDSRTGLRLRRRFLTPVRSLRLAMRPTTSSPGI